MSNVIVRNLQGLAAGTGVATSFSDDFNRANTPYGFGEDWFFGGYQYVAATALENGGINIEANTARFRCDIVVPFADLEPRNFYPVPVFTSLYGVSQFAQGTIVEDTSIAGAESMRAGIGVLSGRASNSDYRQYILSGIIDGVNNRWDLVSFKEGVRVVQLAGGVGSLALNDIMRVEATINVGDVTFEVFKNAISQGTFVDNGAEQPRTGSPFIGRDLFSVTAGPSVAQAWDNFSCGRL